MNLTELKQKPASELIKIAQGMGIEGTRSRKQDVIFSILKSHAKSGEDIFGAFRMALVSCARQTAPISPARMTSMSHPARFAVLVCVPVIRFPVKSGHRKKASVTLPC